jgi:protein-S-isoprenylcysteine O-methyltransferase Ste14
MSPGPDVARPFVAEPRGCPRWVVALCGLAGPALHGALLLAPLAVMGRAGRALGDPAVRAFLVLATAFYLTDLRTLGHAPAAAFRPGSADDRAAGRGGWLAGMLLVATFWTALLGRATAAGPVPLWSFACGALLMPAGVAARAAAVATLGVAFESGVTFAAGRPLTERGIYSRVRHPSEAGNLAVAFGACLLLGSRPALLLALTAFLPVTLARINREDRGLAAAFGPRFDRYARRVKRLIPGVF